MFDILYDDSWMGHCAKYQLESGGKRFRVILALIASKMFGLSKDISKSIAICCEFIHNASLIHDDLKIEICSEEDFQQYGTDLEITLQ